MPEQHIIRTVKNRQNPYTMIARAPLNNAGLSWEARGVLAYLLDKPDNWEVRFSDLVSKGPGGRDHMRRILRELEAAGHIQRARTNSVAGGHYLWETRVYETPFTPTPSIPSTPFQGMVDTAPSTPLPSTVQPSTVQPSTANQGIYRDGTSPSTESNETERERDAPPPSVENFVLTNGFRAWVTTECARRACPREELDLDGEVAKWRDQIRRTGSVPQNLAADLRIWITRAINWTLRHPPTQKETSPDGRTDRDRRAAEARLPNGLTAREQESADALRAALGALPAPGGP